MGQACAVTPEAVGLVLVSALLHAVWSALIKDSRDPLGFNLLLGLPFLPVALAMAVSVDLASVPRAAWGWLAVSSVIHAAYIYWMARALERAPLSAVYPIMRSTPAFLPLVAIPILGESLSPAGALGIATVVAGMWLVHTEGRTGLGLLRAPGTGFAYGVLAATVAYSVTDKAAMVALHGAVWEEPVPRAPLYFVLLVTGHTILFAPLALRRVGLRRLAAQGRTEWRRALLAAAGSMASYTLILEALRLAPVSYVAAVRQSSVLFAVALGAAWLRERPSRARVSGAVLTVAGVALVSLAG